MPCDHINQNKMKLMTLLTLFLPAGGFNQTGLYPAIPKYKRFQDKGCNGYLIGGHMEEEAYQCAKGCDSEPTCEAFVMRPADTPCRRKSYACSENETNSNAGRVFYVKGQIEPRLCELGYFPDVAGYRKLYGDCAGSDIDRLMLPTKECAAARDALPDCTGIVAVNRAVYGAIDNNCYLKSFCNESTLVTSKAGLFTYFKGLVATDTLAPQIVVAGHHALTDFNVSSCFNSNDITSGTTHPATSIMINNVHSNTLTVHLYHGETGDIHLCDKLANVLVTPFQATECNFYKHCRKTWECNKNRICEYRCPCPGNGECQLNILDSVMKWNICDIRV